MSNNPIRFIDPTGHYEAECAGFEDNCENKPAPQNGGGQGNGNSDEEDPEEDLTKNGESFCRAPNQCYDGEGMKALFAYYSQNPGWWNSNGASSFTLEKFLGMMLMYELGQGVAGEDLLIKAAILQIWGDSSSVGGHGPYCSGTCENGVFNFLAAYAQSAQKRYDLIIKQIDPKTGLPWDGYNVLLDQPCCWDPSVPYSGDVYSAYFSERAANIGHQVLNPNQEDTIYTQDKPYHWGNYTKVGSIPPFYSFENFHIFSTAAHNSANAAGGSLINIP